MKCCDDIGNMFFQYLNQDNNKVYECSECEKDYVIMCRTGVRSAQICEFLANQNFKSVSNLLGGINEWVQKVDSSQQVY